MYYLKPAYGDMSPVFLGNTLDKVIEELKDHWEEQLEEPDEYGEEYVKAIEEVLASKGLLEFEQKMKVIDENRYHDYWLDFR